MTEKSTGKHPSPKPTPKPETPKAAPIPAPINVNRPTPSDEGGDAYKSNGNKGGNKLEKRATK